MAGARPRKRRAFVEAVLAAIVAHPEWTRRQPKMFGPLPGGGLGVYEHPTAFPSADVPREALEGAFEAAYGRRAGRGFNGKGDIESALAGAHDGDLKKGKSHLPVFEEGLRFYLTTGRCPTNGWSPLYDRNGEPKA